MILVHLIFLIIRLASGGANQAARASGPAVGSRQRTKGADVALECPFCKTLGVAGFYGVFQYQFSGWIREMNIYECNNCRRTMNADAMQNDGSGVMTAKQWGCPSCLTQNPAVIHTCGNCGHALSA